jgi:hypothetical protein
LDALAIRTANERGSERGTQRESKPFTKSSREQHLDAMKDQEITEGRNQAFLDVFMT